MQNIQDNQWLNPSKRIFDASDINNFKKSIAYYKIRHTLSIIIEKVKGCDVPPGVLDSSIVTRKKTNIPPPGGIQEASGILTQRNLDLPPPEEIGDQAIADLDIKEENKDSNFCGLLRIFQELNKYIDETPPLRGPRRFGNLACREWHAKMTREIEGLLKANIMVHNSSFNHQYSGFITELKYYIVNSFGSPIRLDYGTGHELSFLAFIGGLIDFKILNFENLNGSDILTIFARYYDLTRRLILVYNLEPAGSHGVWGLDDHFHLIYILGAAQFNGNPDKIIPPVLQVLTKSVLDSYKETNLYVNAVSFIHKIKLGPFNEHSPIIFDIHSSVSLWSKVLSGLLKMFEVEVLGKFPVVQHFWFGSSLYPWRNFETNEELPIYQRGRAEAEEQTGFLNGESGIKTTKSNISMTGAPWAMPSRSSNTNATPFLKSRDTERR